MTFGIKTHIGRGLAYAKTHPNVLLVLLLLFILPPLLLYTNQQFLEAGRANQDRLQKDRIGLMHDVIASLLRATSFSSEIAQDELAYIAAVNPDIMEFKIVMREGQQFKPIAGVPLEHIGQPEESEQLYRDAAVRLDESIIFEFDTTDGRQWFAYRALETPDGELYYIHTRLSLLTVDQLFASTARQAMWSLVFVYLFIAALAYWHIRMTDYRYLYGEVKKANETKDLFTHMIAHELRAPLTAIRGYASMIEESPQSEASTDYARRIRESSERLVAIVGDLLDVARIQSGKLKVELSSADVGPIISRVVAEQTAALPNSSLRLLTEGIDAQLLAQIDAKRLHQALTNLISNAIKYTREGAITVAASVSDDTLEIRVKDTGMGISSEDQQKLFAPFFRVESTDVNQITGTGLGMLITKQLIELMGGTIAVESIKGVGTHVVVHLRAHRSGK